MILPCPAAQKAAPAESNPVGHLALHVDVRGSRGNQQSNRPVDAIVCGILPVMCLSFRRASVSLFYRRFCQTPNTLRRRWAQASLQLKCKTKTKMKRAHVFMLARIWVHPVIEPDRPDGKFVTQACADRIAHVIETGFIRIGKQVAGIEKNRTL